MKLESVQRPYAYETFTKTDWAMNFITPVHIPLTRTSTHDLHLTSKEARKCDLLCQGREKGTGEHLSSQSLSEP